MKKTFAVMAMFALVLVSLPKTSWQTFYNSSDILIVHETNDPNSAICWSGKAHSLKVNPSDGSVTQVDNYDGHCTDRSL